MNSKEYLHLYRDYLPSVGHSWAGELQRNKTGVFVIGDVNQLHKFH